MKLVKDIKALVTGLRITGKHLGRHAITIQYPEERWEMPERSRGIVVLLSDKETGELNCTSCLLCEKACPTAAIRIDAPRDEKKKRHLKSFVVDHSLCCFCGLCEESCNFAALKMAGKYEFSTTNKEDLIWDVNKLQEAGRDVPYTPRPKKKKPAAKKPAKPAAKPDAETAKPEKPVKPEASESKPDGPAAEDKPAKPEKPTPKAESDTAEAGTMPAPPAEDKPSDDKEGQS